MKISGIVFDKDGTLLEIQPFWAGVVRYAAEEVLRRIGFSGCPQDLFQKLMEAAGLRRDGEIIPEGLVVSGTNADIAYAWEQLLLSRRLSVPETFCPDTRDLLGNSYSQGQVRGPEGLPALLRALRQQGLKLAVATSDDLEQTDYCLKRLNIRELVFPVMTADQVENSKPDPEMMCRISQIWDLPPEEILMVGDSANDMRFAANSGAAGVFLAAPGTPLPEGAVAEIGRLDELPRLLTELGKTI